MGFDWASNAPAGGQLICVDNVGNTIKRLAISGTAVSIANQIPSPAGSPDLAEGLGYDGDLMWTCGAYASAGVVWKLDDGFVSGQLPLDVNISHTGSIVIPANGGSFQYNINIHNLGTIPVTLNLWNKLRDASNHFYLVFGPISRTLPGGANPSRVLSQNVAGTIPSGTLYFISYVGTYPGSIADSSFFTITKAATVDGGPWISESTVSGDLFSEFAEANEKATHASSLQASISPNPFNPVTSIRFNLPEASQVTLEVFDVGGRAVVTQNVASLPAGSQSITFDGSDLPSGVYIYKLTTGDFNASGKMVLLK